MLTLLSTSLGFSADPLGALKTALQQELDLLSSVHPSFALNLGWTSTEGSFGLAAGSVNVPGQPPRAALPADRYLFGSGTKPVTATAVLRLMEAGALSLDDPVSKHVDPVLKAANGTSMVGLFGSEAAAVTVGHLLHMQSGLPDFDTKTLDDAILLDGSAEWPPYAILHVAASQIVAGKLHFTPGTRVEYSSTNFVMAGLVLLAHSPDAANDWKKLDLFSLALPAELHAKYSNVRFINDEPISAAATVPGASAFIPTQNTTIWAQKGGILGWTCGNMAASALDMAHFLHDLLVARAILKPSSLALMEQFHLLSYGWAEGRIYYGAGLMIEQPATTSPGHRRGPPVFGDWGAYMGHGGDTYGFLSEQGIISKLGNASFSVVANMDSDYNFVTSAMACRLIQAAAKALQDTTINLYCIE